MYGLSFGVREERIDDRCHTGDSRCRPVAVWALRVFAGPRMQSMKRRSSRGAGSGRDPRLGQRLREMYALRDPRRGQSETCESVGRSVSQLVSRSVVERERDEERERERERETRQETRDEEAT